MGSWPEAGVAPAAGGVPGADGGWLGVLGFLAGRSRSSEALRFLPLPADAGFLALAPLPGVAVLGVLALGFLGELPLGTPASDSFMSSGGSLAARALASALGAGAAGGAGAAAAGAAAAGAAVGAGSAVGSAMLNQERRR